MDSQVLHVMTISNSIIGVSLLAMPYCFKQCGIILSILILIASSILSRLSCHLLLKSAIIARRRTFEVLAFHTFGSLGKFATEIGIIGFLIGTCIAFFVIMGDLGPTIVAKMTGTTSSDTMRTSILMALALFCVLPLGLLRNIDSLSSVCTATVVFYFCLVVKIIAEAFPHLFSTEWINKVELWRPAGILQCLPIFSMALSCQTQIFEIYQVVQNASLEKMNNLIKLAVNICSCVYIFVGTFGYIAFCNQTFTGNILMSFSSSFLSDAIKIGFVLSVAFSFPLVIFPCRASLYSLLYKQAYSLHEGTDKYIPEGRFKGITFVIICIPLVIGIMIPNIELVLGLMGSTIGIIICVIFPATCFICISTKNTNERVLAQIMLFSGILIMVLGTYANLFTTDGRVANTPIPESILLDQNIPPETKLPNVPKLSEKVNKVPEPPKQEGIKNFVKQEPPQLQATHDNKNSKAQEAPLQQNIENVIKPDVLNNNIEPPKVKNDKLQKIIEHKAAEPQVVHDSQIVNKESEIDPKEFPKSKPESSDNKEAPGPDIQQQIEIRREPPQPMEPEEVKIDTIQVKKEEAIDKNPPIENNNANNPLDKIQDPVQTNENVQAKLEDSMKTKENNKIDVDTKREVVAPKQESPSVHDSPKIDLDKQTVDIEAIKKEDKELLEQEKAELTKEEKRNQELLKTLQEQNEEQQKLVEKSKKVLEEIKQRQQILEERKQKVIEKVKQVESEKEAVVEVPDKNKNEIVIKKELQDDLKLTNEGNVKLNKEVQEQPSDLKLNKGNLLPLANTLNKKETKTVEEQQLNNKLNLPELKKVQLENENELPVLHREIRGTNLVDLKDGREACDTKKESVKTEGLVIKMDTKLSDPEIVNIKADLHDVDSKVNELFKKV